MAGKLKLPLAAIGYHPVLPLSYLMSGAERTANKVSTVELDLIGTGKSYCYRTWPRPSNAFMTFYK